MSFIYYMKKEHESFRHKFWMKMLTVLTWSVCTAYMCCNMTLHLMSMYNASLILFLKWRVGGAHPMDSLVYLFPHLWQTHTHISPLPLSPASVRVMETLLHLEWGPNLRDTGKLTTQKDWVEWDESEGDRFLHSASMKSLSSIVIYSSIAHYLELDEEEILNCRRPGLLILLSTSDAFLLRSFCMTQVYTGM